MTGSRKRKEWIDWKAYRRFQIFLNKLEKYKYFGGDLSLNRRQIDLKNISKYEWLLFEKNKLFSRPIKLSLNFKEYRNHGKPPEEVMNVIYTLIEENAMKVKAYFYEEVTNMFDAVLVTFFTKEYSSPEYKSIKEIQELSIAEIKGNEVEFYLLKFHDVIVKYGSWSNFLQYLEDYLPKNSYKVKRINNVKEIYVKDTNFYFENVKDVSFMMDKSKRKIYILDDKAKRYAKQMKVRISRKMFKLITKLLLLSNSDVKKSLSKYQRDLYYILRKMGVIKEIYSSSFKDMFGRRYKKKLIELEMWFLKFIEHIMSAVLSMYKIYLNEKKRYNSPFNLTNFTSFCEDFCNRYAKVIDGGG